MTAPALVEAALVVHAQRRVAPKRFQRLHERLEVGVLKTGAEAARQLLARAVGPLAQRFARPARAKIGRRAAHALAVQPGKALCAQVPLVQRTSLPTPCGHTKVSAQKRRFLPRAPSRG